MSLSPREQIVASVAHDFVDPILAVRQARLEHLRDVQERSSRVRVQPMPDEDIQRLGDWCVKPGLAAIVVGEAVNLATEIATSGESIPAQGLAQLGAWTFLLGATIKWMGRN